MREILFKGKSIKTKKWVYGGFYVGKDRETGIAAPTYIVDQQTQEHMECYPESIFEWTGTKVECSDGIKELFEGDIIRIETDDDYRPLFMVGFGLGGNPMSRYFEDENVLISYMGFVLLPLNNEAWELEKTIGCHDFFGIIRNNPTEIIGSKFDLGIYYYLKY